MVWYGSYRRMYMCMSEALYDLLAYLLPAEATGGTRKLTIGLDLKNEFLSHAKPPPSCLGPGLSPF